MFVSRNKTPISKCRLVINITVLCFSIVLIYCAAFGLENLQSTLNAKDGLGIISEVAGYVATIISSLFLPKLLIKKFGCKNTLFLCAFTFIPWIAANIHPSFAVIIPCIIIAGAGTAVLYTAACTYINGMSASYSKQSEDSTEVITSRFFGIFLMAYESSGIWGHLVSFIVLTPSISEKHVNETWHGTSSLANFSNVSEVVCGASFCPGTSEGSEPPGIEKRYVLMGIYLAMGIVASILLGCFLDPLDRTDDDENICSGLIATMRHLKKTDQILMIPLNMSVGIQIAFLMVDYTKAFVACAWGIHHVPIVLLCISISETVISYFSGCMIKYLPRMLLMYIGAALHTGACAVLLLWEPTSDQYPIFFALAVTVGTQSALTQTQINALYGILFRSEEEAAFANLVLWQSIGSTLSFCFSLSLCIVSKLYIMVAFNALGMVGYTAVEIRRKKSTASPEEKIDVPVS